jgi:hypothetical protein
VHTFSKAPQLFAQQQPSANVRDDQLHIVGRHQLPTNF